MDSIAIGLFVSLSIDFLGLIRLWGGGDSLPKNSAPPPPILIYNYMNIILFYITAHKEATTRMLT